MLGIFSDVAERHDYSGAALLPVAAVCRVVQRHTAEVIPSSVCSALRGAQETTPGGAVDGVVLTHTDVHLHTDTH